MGGVLVGFEGTEGSGKSSQLRHAAEWLSPGVDVVSTREPGGTPTAEAIRSLVLSGSDDARDATTEAFLMNAARRDHCTRVVGPALARGAVVLTDRFAASTLAYQGAAGGVDSDWLRRLEELATDGLQPDLYLLFDLDVEVGLRRRLGSTEVNAIDERAVDFHRRVRDGYLSLATQSPARWTVIDGDRAPDAVWTDVSAALTRTLRASGIEPPR